MERLLASRKATGLDPPGLFVNMQGLLDSKKQKLSDEELIAESSTLFFAGKMVLTLCQYKLTRHRHGHNCKHCCYRAMALAAQT
jgi:hypothetical protein